MRTMRTWTLLPMPMKRHRYSFPELTTDYAKFGIDGRCRNTAKLNPWEFFVDMLTVWRLLIREVMGDILLQTARTSPSNCKFLDTLGFVLFILNDFK